MKTKSVFFCTECGNEYAKWMGKCPSCGSWNTLVEQESVNVTGKTRLSSKSAIKKYPKTLNELDTVEEIRFSTGMDEFDRVLGGGAVKGSLVLVGGAPGIGKSTLLLQICNNICDSNNVLYVSGEESERQIKMRAERLDVNASNLFILSETNINDISDVIEEEKPDVLIIDSIQTLYSDDSNSSPGSVSQVKECTNTLMHIAKSYGVTTFVIGHVNKDGAIAGPKVLEHMVDCVLYFEGVASEDNRILRAAKNRFGSTNEIGLFEMTKKGLIGIPNASEMLLAGRPMKTPGTCVTCVMEGTRPILAEVQALVATSNLNVPRRTSNGFDYNRTLLLIAVIEKKGKVRIGASDIYLNVIGGLSIDETGADFATVLSIVSSYRDKSIPDDVVAIGEVGLTGEIRNVSQIELRLLESSKMGFKLCIIPKQYKKTLTIPDGLKVCEVKTVEEALSLLKLDK